MHHDTMPAFSVDQIFTQWRFDPLLIVALLLLVAYLIGVARANRNAGTEGTRWHPARTISFIAALVVGVLATSSGVAVYSDMVFSVHMIQHLMLIMVAPSLFAFGKPLRLIGAAGGPGTADRLQHFLSTPIMAVITSPMAGVAAYAGVLVGTHLTALMNIIMTHPGAAELEHWAYLAAGWMLFVHVFGEEPLRWHLSMPGRFLMLAVTMAVDTFVGVVLMLNTTAIATSASAMGSLADTHAGGGLMWWGGDGLMAIQAVVLFWIWANQPDRTRRAEDSFYERSRRATFAEHTGYVEPEPDAANPEDPAARTEADDEEARRQAYNRWLAKLNEASQSHRR